MSQTTVDIKTEKRKRIFILSIILTFALAGIITVVVYREQLFGESSNNGGGSNEDPSLYSRAQLNIAMGILGVAGLFIVMILVYKQIAMKRMQDIVSLHDANTTIRYLLDVALGLGFVSAILATSAGVPEFSPAKSNMPSSLYLLPWVFSFVVASFLCIIILVKGTSMTLIREVSNMLFFLIILTATIAAILTCDLNGNLTFLSILFTVLSGLTVVYTLFKFLSGDLREVRRDAKFDLEVPEAALERVATVITGDDLENGDVPIAESVFPETNPSVADDLGSTRNARRLSLRGSRR
jgi:hypothetical protein